MRVKLPALLFCGALSGAAIFGSAFASGGRELLFSAPIQQIDRTIGTVTVLGETFDAKTDELAVGQIVNVYGVLAANGKATDTVVSGTANYGANGDPVFVKGTVTNSDPILGRIEVDGMSIDYTSQLSKPGFTAPSTGDVVEIAASQPAQKGTLVALAIGSDAYSAGATGGGTSLSGSAAVVAGAGNSSGVNVSGMTGGGAMTSGMTGGGAMTSGMTGGGSMTSGMTGGGSRTSGMTGGGAARY